MKITPLLDEKINIYDSEMSDETIESYEKYYKNQNECKTVDDSEKELHCDRADKVLESNEESLCNDKTKNLTDTRKCENNNDSDRKRVRNLESATEALPNKKRKKEFEPPKLREDNRDIFCWRCHKYVSATDVIPCYFCPRVFHLKCVHIQEKPSTFWLCMECDAISAAENPDKISPALSKLQKKDLAELLMYVLKRMRQHEGSSHYENPVDLESYPDYKDYIVKPMYLSLLENNVQNLKYSSCESFLADTKWMVHNSYVFNTVHSELTLYAKAMMKNAKHECDEIINCPDCYLHANTLEEDKWFIEPCDKPHILVWARLKGFPYWPCKVMKANGTNVDVRFFGDHNKSLVPVECCYLYSKQMPSKQKKVDELEIAIKEASQHIKRLQERFHVFQYAPLKTLYNPKEEDEQRKLLLPYHDKPFYIKVKDREKLFDPNIIKNIFDEPLSYHKAEHKEECVNNTLTELPDTVEMKNRKNVLKPLNEEFSSYRLSSVNVNMTPSNKPTIIIEDSDSDILTQNSFSHARQHNIQGCEKLNSSCTPSKIRLSMNEKHAVGSPTLPINHELDNNMCEITTDLNCMQNPNNLKNCHLERGMDVAYNSADEKANDEKPVTLFRDYNVSSDLLKSDDKNAFTSEQVNCSPLSNPPPDKCNNNHFSDKLRINSNAKLINVITDNPALISNYIFKPMVVIQKLRDEVFRDYSNINRKNEGITAEQVRQSDENDSSNGSSGDYGGGKVPLNFDLLNGNLTDLVSLTEIDLDKDESSKINLTYNKEAENINKDNGPRINNGFKTVCRPIKCENIDDDEPVDNDYIERLSKSILESTLDYNNGVRDIEKNKIISTSDIKNGSFEGILIVDSESQSLKKDETIQKYNNSSVQNSANLVIDLETGHTEGVIDPHECKIVKSTAGDNSLVVDSIRAESNMHRKAIYLCERKESLDQFLGQNKDNRRGKDQIGLNVIACEIKSNEVKKTENSSNSIENKKHGFENMLSYLDDKMEYLNEKCQSTNIENDKLQNEENRYNSQDESLKNKDNSENESSRRLIQFSSDESNKIKDTNTPNLQAVQNKEIISDENANDSHLDTDCEIVKIIFPPNSKILKPIGFKRVKTCGGVIKKVIRNGMLLTTSRKRQNLDLSLKGVGAEKLSCKTKFPIECQQQTSTSGSVVKNHLTPNHQSKESITLKNVLEKCSDNMVSGTERVRQEENKMMTLEIEAILSKVENIELKGKLLQVLREELEKFEEHCKKKIESYKNAYIEEMDSLYTMEKHRWIQETMNVSENESRMMVDEIKKKQWCILCLNEAKFHCCWSTSYCSEKCQLADWPVHMKTCTQYSMRIGDPDLRLSPELKKIFRGEHESLNQRIKDLLESDRFTNNHSKITASSPSCSNNMAKSCEGGTKDCTNSTLTLPRSSTIFVPKNNLSKEDIPQGLENSGNQVMKIVSNQAVYLSGMVAPPSQTKNIIHVSKPTPSKSNILYQNPPHSLHVPYS